MEELKAEREKRKNRTGEWGKCNGYFVSLVILFHFLVPFFIFSLYNGKFYTHTKYSIIGQFGFVPFLFWFLVFWGKVNKF